MDLDALFNVKVTTASKFAQKLADAPGVMSVVSSDELRRFGGITLREVLERVAGLSGFGTSFSDGSIMAVRGDQARLDGGHVLILINGRPTREVLEGGISGDILESFPVNILERIEVIKGPGSVLYGSDAFSGVINLITRKPEGGGIHFRSAGGGAGAQASSAEILFERGDFSMVAAGQYHQKPRWSAAYRYFDQNPESPRVSQSSTQNLTIADRGVGAYLGINYKGLSFMSSFTEWQTPSLVQNIPADARRKRGFADLGYAFRVSARWDMSVNLTYTRHAAGVSDFPWIENGSNEAVLEWTNFVRLSERDKLTFGGLYNRVQGSGTYLGPGPAFTLAEGSRSGTGFYAQHEHRLRDNLKLIGGFQLNKTGSIDVDVVPRGGVVWNPAAHWTVKTLYGGAFRAPSISELTLNYPQLKGNPLLGAEKVGTFDAGIGYQGTHLQAGVNYFHSRQTGRILPDQNVFPQRYLNRGEAIFQGLEFESKCYFARNWLAMGSVLYQTSTDRTDKLAVTPIPHFGAKAGLSYMAENGWTASAFDVYQARTDGYTEALNPQPVARHLLNAHARFDLTRHWMRGGNTGIALFVHGDNLTNQPVWLPDWGFGSRDTVPARAGRTLYFGIEVWQKR